MSKTILIAEDEPSIRDMMAEDLREEGQTVETAKDGEEAIAMMDARQPALLLLDVLMPKKDGFDVLLHIREKGYRFPVLVLSNLTEPKDEERCYALGAKAFMVKSQLDSGDLWKKVRKYL